jgi:hypothetical protein
MFNDWGLDLRLNVISVGQWRFNLWNCFRWMNTNLWVGGSEQRTIEVVGESVKCDCILQLSPFVWAVGGEWNDDDCWEQRHMRHSQSEVSRVNKQDSKRNNFLKRDCDIWAPSEADERNSICVFQVVGRYRRPKEMIVFSKFGMNAHRRWISKMNSILSIILPRNEEMNEFYRWNLNNLNQSRSHSRFSRFHFRPHSLSNSNVPTSKHRQSFNTYTYINSGIEKREEMKMNRPELKVEHG